VGRYWLTEYLGVLGGLAALCAGQSTPYNNQKFSYSLRPPPGWNLSESSSSVPLFFNYDASEGRSQAMYPERGAEIRVIPLGVDPRTAHFTTLSEWIDFDLRHDHSKISTKSLSNSAAEAAAPRGVIEVESDFMRENGQIQHEVSYFFFLRDSMFRLTLAHWLGNPDAKGLHAAAEAVLHSIRAR
jgi:hypothetical protein